MVASAFAVGLLEAFQGGPTAPLVGVLGVAVAVAGGLWLKTAPRPLPHLASLPVGFVLLAEAVTSPPSLLTLALGTAAGLVTILWTGLGQVDRSPVPGSLLARELALPLAGGAVALVVAGIPLLPLLRPAALVITAFAGLCLLIVLIAELGSRPLERPQSSPE